MTSPYRAGLDHDRDGFEVLGRGADHRRARRCRSSRSPRRRPRRTATVSAERVEVHDDEVERLDPVLLELGEGARACRRSARMPPWIRGCSVLTRPPSISGEPVTSETAVTAMPASRSAAAVPPDETISTPELRQLARELHHAGLVRDRDERAADAAGRRSRRALGHHAAGGPPRGRAPRPAPRSGGLVDAGAPTSWIRRVQASTRRRRPGPGPPAAGRWARGRPPRRRRCTVAPVTFTPHASASGTAFAPGNEGSSEGWTFSHPALEGADDLGPEDPHEAGVHDEPDVSSGEHLEERGVEPRPIVERGRIQEHCLDAGGAAALERSRLLAVRDDQRHPGPNDRVVQQRLQVRSDPRRQHRDPRIHERPHTLGAADAGVNARPRYPSWSVCRRNSSSVTGLLWKAFRH